MGGESSDSSFRCVVAVPLAVALVNSKAIFGLTEIFKCLAKVVSCDAARIQESV